MIFSTAQFLACFALFLPAYWLLPDRWRRPVLLGASYYFYMCAVPWTIVVILGITAIDFVAGLRIERARTRRAKRLALAVSLAANLAVLGWFKYAGFFAVTLNDLLGTGLPIWRVVLPLGISFHTFQAISYTVEVYRGRVPAERSLLDYALYVAFFPQMVAGPIERPYNLLPQFHRPKALTFEAFRSGAQLALWGLVKKVVVADLLAPVVATVYGAPRAFSGPVLLLATFFFAVQIYCDFSGYTDMARGIARLLGYELMLNFRQPYLARSIGEFWRRWHISLSTWFRDYVYIPLGGSRGGTARTSLNIMLVFVASGLWHGASWTFVVWGALHGAYLLVGRLTAPFRARLRAAAAIDASGAAWAIARTATTFTLVLVAWPFFRARSIGDAAYVFTHVWHWRGARAAELLGVGLPRFELATAFAFIAALAVVEYLLANHAERVARLWSVRAVRWASYYAQAFLVVFFGVFQHIAFIYFQF